MPKPALTMTRTAITRTARTVLGPGVAMASNRATVRTARVYQGMSCTAEVQWRLRASSTAVPTMPAAARARKHRRSSATVTVTGPHSLRSCAPVNA